MINILIDRLPKFVYIDNREYKINSNFRTSILFELMILDEEMEEEDKILNALNLYYPVLPKNLEKAIDKMLWFYRCGRDLEESKGNGNSGNQIYDFNFDAEYIYDAFLDQYSLDLQEVEYLHWWKFKAMFKGLKEDNEIVKIMKYRGVDLSEIKDKNEKDFYKKMQKLYEIPTKQREIEKEKINKIEEALMGSGNLSKINI